MSVGSGESEPQSSETKLLWKRKALEVMHAQTQGPLATEPPQEVRFPKDRQAEERKKAEAEALRFVQEYIREHGTFPKEEQLLKDPRYAQAVAAEDERIRAEAARELLDRYLRERQIMEKIAAEKKIEEERAQRIHRLIGEAKQKGGNRPTLLAGTENLAPNQILKVIMSNFRNLGFTYSMIHADGTALLNGRKDGDCLSLAEAFTELAHEIGFPEVQVKGEKNLDIVVAGKPCIDPNKAPQIDRGRHWAFDNHYWGVDGSGTIYDILFTSHTVNSGETKWITRDSPDVVDPTTGLTVGGYGGKKFYSGIVGGTTYDMVVLDNSELEKIRETYLQRQQPKQKEIEEEPVEEEAKSPLEQMMDELKMFVPSEKLEQTAQKLSGIDACEKSSVFRTLKDELQKFLDGTNPFNYKFNEERWKKWFG